MRVLECPHCGTVFAGDGGDGFLRCRSCERVVDATAAERLHRVESLRRRLHELTAGQTPEPELARALAAAFQAQRARVLAGMRPPPPEAEPAAEGGTGAGADREPEAVVPAVPGPAPAPAPPRRPSAWQQLGPWVAEHALFALAGFLLLAGGVFFVTTAWTTMSGEDRLWIVVAGLEAFAMLLAGAARVLRSIGGLRPAAHVLALVAATIPPLAAAAAGMLWRLTPLGALAVVLTVVTAGALVRNLFDGSAAYRRWVPFAGAALTALSSSAPWAAAWPFEHGVLVAALVLAAGFAVRRGATASAITGESASATGGGSPWFAATPLLFAGLVATAAVALHAPGRAGTALSPLGIVTAAGALVGALVAARLGAALATTIALASAVLGVALAIGDPRCLMAAAWLASACGAVAGLHLRQPALLLLALALAALGYLFLPAPVREAALRARAAAAEALGYVPERLPLSYYGVTFAPYLLLVGGWIAWLQRRGLAAAAQVSFGWLLAAAAGLATLALAFGTDARAPLASLAALGGTLALLASWLRRPVLLPIAAVAWSGALIAALVHVRADAGIAALCIALWLGVLAGTVRWLARSPAGFAHHAVRLLQPTCLGLGVAALVWAAVSWRWSGAGAVASDTGFAALAVAGRVLLARAQPWLALLIAPAVVRAAFGVLPGFEASLALALAQVFWLALWPTRARPPALPVGILFCHVLAGIAVAESAAALPWSWALAAGAAVGAVALAAAGRRARQRWAVRLAVLESGAIALLVTGALGFDPGGSAGCLALALVAAVTLLVPATAATGQVLAAGAAIWHVLARFEWLATTPPALPATHVLLGGVVAGGAALVAARRGGTARELATAMLALASVFTVTAAAALVDLTGVVPGALPLAFGAGAAIVLLGARTAERDAAHGIAMAQTALGFYVLLALVLFRPQLAPAWLVLLECGAVIVLAGVTRRASPIAASGLQLLAAALAVIPVLAGRVFGLGAGYVPALVLGFAAAALALGPHLRLERRATVAFALPFVVVATVGRLLGPMLALGRLHGSLPRRDQVGWPFAIELWAIAYLLAVAAFGRALGITRWILVPAAILASFQMPLVNDLLHADYGPDWRPDVECGLIALVAALVLARRARSPLDGLTGLAVLVPAGFAAWLTHGEIGDVTTPVAVLLAAVAPAPLLRRVPDLALTLAHGVGLVLGAIAIGMFVVARGNLREAMMLALLAAECVVLASALRPWGDWWLGGERTADRAAALRALRGIATCTLVLGLVLLSVLLIVHALFASGSPRPAPALEQWLVLGAAALAFAVAARRARSEPWFTHVAVASVLLAHAHATFRGQWLALLANRYPETLIVFGATLLVAAARATTGAGRALGHAGIALPVVGSLLALTALARGGDPTAAWFVAAAAYGLGAAVRGSPPLGALALAFANFALFSLWWNRGIFDPAFYGVPPGLTLLLATEVARRTLTLPAFAALRLVGFALLYGSLAVQVLRVEEPTHALVLFALGLAAVAAGIPRRRHDLVLAGSLAVVLDVVVYLARHGLERDLLGALLLVGAGATLFAVAAVITRRRRRRPPALELPANP